jgi:pimeloyl-[acyl-carrier protein] synthase
MVESLRSKIEDVMADLLRSLRGRKRFDVMACVAEPLPTQIIAHLLGLPQSDVALFRRWSDALRVIFDMTLARDGLADAYAAAVEARAYIGERLSARRSDPGDDLISRMVLAQRRGDGLTDDEILSTGILLLAGGNETTSGLIGNGLLALLRQQDAWEQLDESHDLLPTAVQELLRFDSPTQTAGRMALDDVAIGGQTIAKGDEVLAILGAANRDPAVFHEPDRLDLRRHPNRHVSFGSGEHYCIGAPLAALEAEVALGALRRSLRSAEIVEDKLRWRRGHVNRGLELFMVRVEWRD